MEQTVYFSSKNDVKNTKVIIFLDIDDILLGSYNQNLLT